MKHKTEKLILGLGNEILTDDGIGPKLVEAIKKKINRPGISYLTAAAGGMEILEMIKDYNEVMIIDAIRTKDGIPGTIYHLTPKDFRETLHISSFHDVNFLTALKLAEKIDIAVPERIEILAVEIVEDLTFSNEFSPEIRRKFNLIYTEVIEKVIAFIEGGK
jgi:hydrogenase maturation protease